MAGKILRIVSNDLYGNVDERKIVVFACFQHTKYMNNYVIFSFEGEYHKKKLCYGSLHLKNDSLVIFSVKENVKKYIDEFVCEYLSDELSNYKILDIEKIEKTELVSYNEMEYDNLELLDEKSIARVNINENIEKGKKPIFLYLLLVILVLFSLGLTLLYFYPEIFTVKYKELVCNSKLYDQRLMLDYDIDKEIRFGENDKLVSIDVVRTYNFLDSNSYYEFKDNKRYEQYFNDGEGYKFIDDEFKFKLIYEEDSVIDDYEEMLQYLNREGFNCIEKEYEK